MSSISFINNYVVGDWEIDPNSEIVKDNFTNETYKGKSEITLRLKYGLIMIGNVPRTVITLLYDLAKLIWDTCHIFATAIANFVKSLNEDVPLKQAFVELGKDLNHPDFEIDLTQIILDVCSGVLMEFGCLYGFIDPFNGRKVLANLEKNGFNWSRKETGYYLYRCLRSRSVNYLTPPKNTSTSWLQKMIALKA